MMQEKGIALISAGLVGIIMLAAVLLAVIVARTVCNLLERRFGSDKAEMAFIVTVILALCGEAILVGTWMTMQ